MYDAVISKVAYENISSFLDFQISVYRGSRAVEIIPGAKNRVL